MGRVGVACVYRSARPEGLVGKGSLARDWTKFVSAGFVGRRVGAPLVPGPVMLIPTVKSAILLAFNQLRHFLLFRTFKPPGSDSEVTLCRRAHLSSSASALQRCLARLCSTSLASLFQTRISIRHLASYHDRQKQKGIPLLRTPPPIDHTLNA